jgi:hypothetical protein
LCAGAAPADGAAAVAAGAGAAAQRQKMSFFDDVGADSIWDAGLGLFQKRSVVLVGPTPLGLGPAGPGPDPGSTLDRDRPL